MRPNNKVKITSDGVITKIFVDDKELEWVKEFNVHQSAVDKENPLLEVKITFFVGELELDGVARCRTLNSHSIRNLSEIIERKVNQVIKKLDDDTPSLDLDGVVEVLERKIKNELL